MARARVLLVDDDASIRRFVAMALEDRDIDLACVPAVPDALAFLGRHGPVQLLITDLMMPGASGVDLLHALAAAPALRGGARAVVLSAGLEGAQGDALAGLDVWRCLRKPVALAELTACVDQALADMGWRRGDGVPAGEGVPAGDGAGVGTGAGAGLAAGATPPALHPAQAQALERHFGGDRGIFFAYHASCIREFANDIPRGEAAVANRDAPGLRRLAHSLKSVLATLGYEAPSALARRLEEVASAGDWEHALPLWDALRQALALVRHVED